MEMKNTENKSSGPVWQEEWVRMAQGQVRTQWDSDIWAKFKGNDKD